MADPPPHLVDTSAWIEGFRPGARGPWVEELRRLVTDRQAGLHPIIRVELLSGAMSEAEYGRLAEVLDALPPVECAQEAWQEAARLGFQLRRKGVSVPVTDLLIAATAVHHRCLLIHCDRHFVLVAKHSPLQERSLPTRTAPAR
ncbi:MAG: PIN domain nuclease [Candidatus Coatesbacteria bacterium]